MSFPRDENKTQQGPREPRTGEVPAQRHSLPPSPTPLPHPRTSSGQCHTRPFPPGRRPCVPRAIPLQPPSGAFLLLSALIRQCVSVRTSLLGPTATGSPPAFSQQPRALTPAPRCKCSASGSLRNLSLLDRQMTAAPSGHQAGQAPAAARIRPMCPEGLWVTRSGHWRQAMFSMWDPRQGETSPRLCRSGAMSVCSHQVFTLPFGADPELGL